MGEGGRTKTASGRRLFIRRGTKFFRLREAQRRFRRQGLSGEALKEAVLKWGRKNKIVSQNRKRGLTRSGEYRQRVTGVSPQDKGGLNKTTVKSRRGGRKGIPRITAATRTKQLGGARAQKRLPSTIRKTSKGSAGQGKASQTRRLKRRKKK